MVARKRSIWKTLGLALAATPVTAVVSIVVITLVGALDETITKIQFAGYWWIILIPAYFVSLIYFLSEQKVRRNRELNKVVNGLMLYLRQQRAKQNKYQPAEDTARSLIRSRVEVWVFSDPDLWSRNFRDEKYPEYLFDIVDNLLEQVDKLEKCESMGKK
jgi:hypothetical protein